MPSYAQTFNSDFTGDKQVCGSPGTCAPRLYPPCYSALDIGQPGTEIFNMPAITGAGNRPERLHCKLLSPVLPWGQGALASSSLSPLPGLSGPRMSQKASLPCLESFLHEKRPRFGVRVPPVGVRCTLEIHAQLLGPGHDTKCGPEGLALECGASGAMGILSLRSLAFSKLEADGHVRDTCQTHVQSAAEMSGFGCGAWDLEPPFPMLTTLSLGNKWAQ